jgi:uncharacterized membrane protein required for colicin V production
VHFTAQSESSSFGESLGETIASIPWIDQVGMVLIGVFMLLGIWRGLWWQVVRLLGVVMSVALARTLTPRFDEAAVRTFDLNPSVSHALVWFVIFCGGLVVSSLLGLIGKKALETMQLGLMDRAGGALAGALTGLVLHSAFLVLISAVGNSEWTTTTLEGSRSARVLNQFSSEWHVLIDAQAAERISERWGDTWDEESHNPDPGDGSDNTPPGDQ